MNYRHAFHAGNHADVLKHSVLLALLDALKRKSAPIFVLDTHAGRGEYRLADDEAQRTGEANDGVGRLANATLQSELLTRYRTTLQRFDPHTPPQRYPGSPRLILDALADRDRLACCELHPEEAQLLKQALRRDPRVGIHQRDGYEGMHALLPPSATRGLVLIDPPYESREAEFDAVLAALADALRRWPVACYMVWYPIKQALAVTRFLREAAMLPCRSAWFTELHIAAEASTLRMNGSGVLLLNAPWQLDQQIEAGLPELVRVLGNDDQAKAQLRWLRRDGERAG